MLNLINHLCLICVLIHLISARMESLKFDINDILDEKLMPASLFWLHDREESTSEKNSTSDPEIESIGDFTDAYSTMGYHRKMMNEYLCSNFVVKQLISEIAPEPPQIQRRLGTAAPDPIRNVTKNKSSKHIAEDSLLFDQGSAGYRNWLSKTTTLDDIYRQFSDNPYGISNNKTRKNAKNRPINRRQSYDDNEEPEEEEFEEGDVTGFAYQQPIQEYQPDEHAASNLQNMPNMYAYPHPTAGSKNVPTGHNYGFSPEQIQAFDQDAKHFSIPTISVPAGSSNFLHPEGYYPSGHEEYAVQPEPVDQSKEIGLKDVMDIALTTLAFLSFGMFILQVLMCITMNKADNNLKFLPMENENPDDIVEEIRRKRSISNNDMQQINEISRRVLISIETALLAQKDNGSCLNRVICENNNFASQQKNGQKLWIPVWGLGLSWLSSRMLPKKSSTSSILESLRAATIGLGKADCKKNYPECDFNIIQSNKEQMRKKRDANQTPFQWKI